ncbi:MAG TPA: hypothetical protein PKC27_06100, partial [Methanomethylovorans sp.]|nr:hypothetical protein [Methanomethylovorans sp.]
IFDDAVFTRHIDEHRTLFKAGDLDIIARHVDLEPDKRVSWGIRPENIILVGPDKDNIEIYENHFTGNVISIVNSSGIEQREKDTDLRSIEQSV